MADYNQFWFVDKRKQTRNLKRWFLIAVSLFVYVGICTVVCVKSMYQPIENYIIQAEYPKVTVDEAKKTNVNGYIKGNVNNQGDTDLKGKYIKFAFYTTDNENIGNEYIEIGELKAQQAKTYELKFRYQNIGSFIITIEDNKID